MPIDEPTSGKEGPAGPQGPQGPTGPEGPAGASAAIAGLYAARPPAGTLGRIYQCTDFPTQFLDNGTDWLPLIPYSGLGTPPPSVATFVVDQPGGGVTFADSGGSISVIAPGNGNARNMFAYVAKAAVQTITACLVCSSFSGVGMGLAFRASVDGKLLVCMQHGDGSLSVYLWPSLTGAAGTALFATKLYLPGGAIWLRLVDDGVNITAAGSRDGALWQSLWSGARTTVSSNPIDQCGIFVNPYTMPGFGRILSWAKT